MAHSEADIAKPARLPVRRTEIRVSRGLYTWITRGGASGKRHKLPVIALCKIAQQHRIRRHRNRPHVSVTHNELTDAGMIAAELQKPVKAVVVVRPFRQSKQRASEAHSVGKTVSTVGALIKVDHSEVAGAEGFFANHQGLAEASLGIP